MPSSTGDHIFPDQKKDLRKKFRVLFVNSSIFKMCFSSYNMDKPRGKRKLGDHCNDKKGVSPKVSLMA